MHAYLKLLRTRKDFNPRVKLPSTPPLMTRHRHSHHPLPPSATPDLEPLSKIQFIPDPQSILQIIAPSDLCPSQASLSPDKLFFLRLAPGTMPVFQMSWPGSLDSRLFFCLLQDKPRLNLSKG